MKTKISIITITLNAEKTLEKCINSVLSQNYTNLEHIIIDGKSKDKTIEIIIQYSKNHNHVKWISEPDNGISDAFNKGVKLATGDLIGIINADDWFEPNVFQDIINFHEKHKHSIICGDLLMHYKHYQRKLCSNPKKLRNQMSIMHPTVFIPRQVYCIVGTYRLDRRIAMDYDLLLRAMIVHKIDFVYIDKCISNMSIGGISNNILKFRIQGLKEVMQIQIEYLHNPIRHYFIFFIKSALIFITNSYRITKKQIKA